MEYVQVGDREVEAITGKKQYPNHCDDRSFMLILVVWGPPVQRGAQKPEFAKVEPKSQPDLVEERAAPSEPIQPETEAFRAKTSGAGWFWSSGTNRLECESVGYTLKETALCGAIWPFDILVLFELERAFS